MRGDHTSSREPNARGRDAGSGKPKRGDDTEDVDTPKREKGTQEAVKQNQVECPQEVENKSEMKSLRRWKRKARGLHMGSGGTKARVNLARSGETQTRKGHT